MYFPFFQTLLGGFGFMARLHKDTKSKKMRIMKNSATQILSNKYWNVNKS